MDKNQKNVHLKNVFNDEQIAALLEEINNNRVDPTVPEQYRPFEEDILGRIMIPFRTPKIVEERVLEIAAEYGHPDLKFTHITSFEYNAKYGQSKLPVHTDKNASQFTIDYQLRSNFDWSNYVLGKKFTLKDNDALIFSGSHQLHWRQKRKLVEGEYKHMVTWHLAMPDYWYFTTGINPITPEMRKTRYLNDPEFHYYTKMYEDNPDLTNGELEWSFYGKDKK